MPSADHGRLVVLRGGTQGCEGCGGRGWVLVSPRRRLIDGAGPLDRRLCASCGGTGEQAGAEVADA